MLCYFLLFGLVFSTFEERRQSSLCTYEKLVSFNNSTFSGIQPQSPLPSQLPLPNLEQATSKQAYIQETPHADLSQYSSAAKIITGSLFVVVALCI